MGNLLEIKLSVKETEEVAFKLKSNGKRGAGK